MSLPERKNRLIPALQKKSKNLCLLAISAVLFMNLSVRPAFAVGPGDALGSASKSTTNTGNTDYSGWYGYTNQDGSDLLYLEKGTEVSKFQNETGDIDWNAAKKDGLDFVMVRLAYGTKEDAYFDVNVKGAQKAGIKVGVYLCST